MHARPRHARAHSPHALRTGRRPPHLVLRPRQQRLVVVVEQQAALRGRQRRVARPRVRVGHTRDELEALTRGRPVVGSQNWLLHGCNLLITWQPRARVSTEAGRPLIQTAHSLPQGRHRRGWAPFQPSGELLMRAAVCVHGDRELAWHVKGCDR
jgi:hypothetical protein